MNRFLRLIRRRPIVVRTYRTRKEDEHRKKVREKANQLARECGLPEPFERDRQTAREAA